MNILRVEKTTLGKFGAPELASLINTRGWKSIMPSALNDRKLLLLSNQLRDLLTGTDWDANHGPGGAALPISLLLLEKAAAKPSGDGLEIEMVTLHEAMTLLSITVDREIVGRMLQRKDDTSDPGLMENLRLLAQNYSEPFRSPCPA